ncbi:hypothetical protein GCM10010919_08630 [Alishewanella longhuensis]|uniref:HTH hxlR-type domain-containing protein n=1 Tax=Alishewanella longhuensis TaxID=1091037 RepID=A0ABQ3KVQ3_9ALTE|nr:hypothetical protein GCM10010919_08630 [Alishewanella longhuensis]
MGYMLCVTPMIRVLALLCADAVQRNVRDTLPSSVEYELTALGYEPLPALDALVKVGHKLREKGFITHKLC